MPLSYRNQSIDLLSKSMDWFLYDNGLHHERVKLFLFSVGFQPSRPYKMTLIEKESILQYSVLKSEVWSLPDNESKHTETLCVDHYIFMEQGI